MVVLIILVIWLSILLWVGIAAWCSHIASTKNRSGAAWFVLGLGLGFVALLIVSCLSTDRAAEKGRRYRRIR